MLLRKSIDNLSKTLGLDLNYFISGSIWIFLGTLISGLLGIALSSLASRTFSIESFGKYSFLFSLLSFISVTALPGINQAVLQAAAENKDGIFKKALKIIFKYSLIGSVLFASGALYFFYRQNFSLALASFLFSIVFPFYTSYNLYNPFLNGKKKFKVLSIINIISQTTTITLAILVLIITKNYALTITTYLLVMTVSNYISTRYIQRFIKNKLSDSNLLRMGKIISISQVFSFAADNLDQFLIPAFIGFEANAVYAIAIILPTQLTNILKIIATVGMPKIAQLKTSSNEILTKKVLQFELLVLIITGGYILFAPHLFKVLYPHYLNQSLILSQLFCLGLLFYPGNLFGARLVAKRSTKNLFLFNLSYSIVSIISFLILIPLFGLVGAIIAKIIVRFSQAFLQFFFYQKMENM